MAEWSPPQEFDGYRLLRLLGRGGMGEVHLAEDRLLQRQVAIKFVSSARVGPEARRRLLQEARAVARLNHPNVLAIYRVGEVDGRPYLVSEFVPGHALSQVALPLPWREVLRIGLELATGLAAAHRRGVLHRDIKAANVMVAEDGSVKLLDFGIAELRAAPEGDERADSRPAAGGSLGVERSTGSFPAGAATPALPGGPTPGERPGLSGARAPRLPPAAAPGETPAFGIATPPARPPGRRPAAEGPAATPAPLAATPPAFSGPRGRRARAALAPRATPAAPGLATPPARGLATPPARGLATPPARHGAVAGQRAAPPGVAVTPLPPAPSPSAGFILGTPEYLAPEIWRGERADFAVDLYALGAVLYRLCCGEPPHLAEDLAELARRAAQGEVRPLTERVEGIDPGFAAAVERCLRPDPAHRPASANELRAALAACQREEGPRTPDLSPGANPYRGLQPFESEHAGLFFGRDGEIRELLARLEGQALVLVAGDSGVGKSSLCRAGILPRATRSLGGGRRWRALTVVPGGSPVAAVAAALAPWLREGEAELAAELREDPAGLARRLRARCGAGRGILLFFDQLEELVTLAGPDELAAVGELLRWLALPSPPLRVLATARADFLARLAALPSFGEELARHLYFLRPLGAERLREAIVGPAAQQGVRFEPSELVDELVEAASQAEGALPLLQFSLAELWEARDVAAQVIGPQALEALGGVRGALHRHAERVLDGLPASQAGAARSLLVRLVSADGTRAVRLEAELGLEGPAARAVLDALVRGRLVVARETPEGPGYQLAHEALLQGWSRLARWLVEDADAQAVRERLDRAWREWQRAGRAPDALWSRRQLVEAQRALRGTPLGAAQRAFLQASARRARRGRVAMALAVASLPLLALALAGGLHLQARQALGRQVAVQEGAAAAALALARVDGRRAEARRQEALRLFDQPAVDEAEERWAEFRGLHLLRGEALSRAGRHLEMAHLLDPDRRDLASVFADLLFERALWAETGGGAAAERELLERLAMYDRAGQRLQAWRAPATLTLALEPRAAQVELATYRAGADGRLRAEPLERGAGAAPPAELPPGSYLLRASAPGRRALVLPFLLQRGQQLRLELSLPAADSVPAGYVYVPPGTFLFGSAAEDGQRRDFFHTVPLHAVETQAYLIAQHETTFGDWLVYLRSLPPGERAAAAPGLQKGGFQGALALRELPDGGWELSMQPASRAFRLREGEPLIYATRRHHGRQVWERLPVAGISVAQSRAYLAWLDRSGRVPGARLCDEREWERAARGADGREYPHGARLEPEDANFDDSYGKDPLAMGPDEVGSHPLSRSPFGLQDMAGNVWEWTRSALAEGEYAARGGSFYFGRNSARCPEREITEPDFRDASVGLRVCADPPRP